MSNASQLSRSAVLDRTFAELGIEDLRGLRAPDGTWEVLARRRNDVEFLGRGPSVSTAIADLLRMLVEEEADSCNPR